MITMVSIGVTISAKCPTQTAQVWGTVWKTEAGEAGEGQIMESFAEPQGAVEAHVRVL